jgi:hypothetical protein
MLIDTIPAASSGNRTHKIKNELQVDYSNFKKKETDNFENIIEIQEWTN